MLFQPSGGKGAPAGGVTLPRMCCFSCKGSREEHSFNLPAEKARQRAVLRYASPSRTAQQIFTCGEAFIREMRATF
jgi:hypothetical protein